MKRLLLCIGLAALVVTGTGCPDHHGSEDSEVLQLIREMVIAYMNKDYELAGSRADRIIQLAPNSTEPYAVRGLIYLAQDSLQQAAQQFEIAIGKPEGDRDHAYVGRAMLNRGMVCTQAIQDGERVLTATPGYKLPAEWMEAEPLVPFVLTADHIKMLVAQCYYLLGQFDKAHQSANSMSIDPVGVRDLDPDSPATWVIGQRAFETYQAALGAALQALEGSVVSDAV